MSDDRPEAAGPPEAGPRRRGHRRAVGGTTAPGTTPPGTGGTPVPRDLSGSRDDTDEGWGDRPAPDDDERILREVPPHW